VDLIHPVEEAASSAVRRAISLKSALIQAILVVVAVELASSAIRKATWPENARMPHRMMMAEEEAEEEAADLVVLSPAANATKKVTWPGSALMMMEVTEVVTKDREEMMVAPIVEVEMTTTSVAQAITMPGELLQELTTKLGENLKVAATTMHGEPILVVEMRSRMSQREIKPGVLIPTLVATLTHGETRVTSPKILLGLPPITITITKMEVVGELLSSMMDLSDLCCARSMMSLYVILMLIAHELIVDYIS
jgi:hypothetical protein